MLRPNLDRFTPTQLIGAFLLLLVLLQFGYPVTLYGEGWLIAYQICYASLLVFGAWATRTPLSSSWAAVASGVIFLGASVYYLFNPASTKATLVTYFALIPYQATLIRRLWHFVERRDEDALPDILAAVCVYLLIGAIFVPVYGLLEILEPNSFVDIGRDGHVVGWQEFQYYSYITLNTVGYGDIRPVGSWARSLSTLEAMTGVLYIAILVSQLISRVRDRERRITNREIAAGRDSDTAEARDPDVPEVLQDGKP